MQQDAQSVGPDSQFADDDDDVSINLSDGDDDGAGDSSGEGTQGGESGDEEHLPAPEASQVVCQQSPDSAESPCAEDSQPHQCQSTWSLRFQIPPDRKIKTVQLTRL